MWNRFETIPERYRQRSVTDVILMPYSQPSIQIDGWLKSGSRIPPRPTNKHRMQQVVHFRLRRNVTTSLHFHISPSRYFAPPCTCWRLTSTRDSCYTSRNQVRSDKNLTGPQFCELQQKTSMRLPMPNKCNEGSCYISRNQTPVTHKVPSISVSIYLSLHLATYRSSYLSTYIATYLPTYLPTEIISVTVSCIPAHHSTPHFTLAIFRTSIYLLASNKQMRVRAIPHETRSRSDKVLTGTKFCELQQKPSVHLPTPNKYNEGSCYSSQNQAPVRHKVLTGTCFCEIQQEPSMYLLASTHMWVTSTRGFVLYLTKTGPGQPKSYDRDVVL